MAAKSVLQELDQLRSMLRDPLGLPATAAVLSSPSSAAYPVPARPYTAEVGAPCVVQTGYTTCCICADSNKQRAATSQQLRRGQSCCTSPQHKEQKVWMELADHMRCLASQKQLSSSATRGVTSTYYATRACSARLFQNREPLVLMYSAQPLACKCSHQRFLRKITPVSRCLAGPGCPAHAEECGQAGQGH
jgi:hypothetical protein